MRARKAVTMAVVAGLLVGATGLYELLTDSTAGAVGPEADLSAPPTGPAPSAPPRVEPVALPVTQFAVPPGALVVAPGATASGRCTTASPCPVATALRSAPVGGTVVLRGGTYRGVDVVVRKRLTLQPYPGERAWVKGSAVVSGWSRQGAGYVSAPGPRCLPGRPAHPYSYDPRYAATARSRIAVFRDGRGLRQVGRAGQVAAGTFFVDCRTRRIVVGDDPRGHLVESTAVQRGLLVIGRAAAGSVVRGLGIAHFADTGLMMFADRSRAEGNVVVANGQEGGQMRGADMVVAGNTWAYNGQVGMFARTRGTVIRGNRYHRNNSRGFAQTWAAGGLKFIHSTNVTLTGNVVTENFAIGLWSDVSGHHNRIIGNVAVNNTQMCLFDELGDSNLIAGNLTVGCSAGIMLSNTSRARVVNNTLVGGGGAIVVKDNDRRNTVKAEIAQGITWDAYGNELRNNILAARSGNSPIRVGNCGMTPRRSMLATVDHNAYLVTGGARVADWQDGGFRCGTRFTGLADLQRATGKERHGRLLTSTAGVFRDLARGDYRLAAGSPLKGRGAPVAADVATALGVRPGVAVDLGVPGGKVATPTAPGVPAPVPSPSPSPGAAGAAGLVGTYFTGTDLSGPAVTRVDPDIDFAWSSAPVPGVPARRFSARWSGYLMPRHTGTHLIRTIADDGVRVRIDGTLVVDRWRGGSAVLTTGRVRLVEGRRVPITVEYCQYEGPASVRLLWAEPDGRTSTTPVPAAQLSH